MESVGYFYAILVALMIVIFTFAAYLFIWKVEAVKPVSEFKGIR